MWKKPLCVLLCFSQPLQSYAKTIREIEGGENKIVGVNTALGFSTILEFDSKPISAVVGDQDAFKLEFVGQSITVKPLIPHAQSNLFVFTEYDRFNCTLRAGSATNVDYIVKIKAAHPSLPGDVADSKRRVPDEKPTEFGRREIHQGASWGGFTLTIQRLVQVKGLDPSRAVTVIEVKLVTKNKPYAFSPQSLGVKQSGHFATIESIYLDSLNLRFRQAVHGKIVLLSQDFKPQNQFAVVFAVPGRKAPHRIEVALRSQRRQQPNKKGK